MGWIYKNKGFNFVIEGIEAFVYLIERTNIKEDNISPTLYIGKKSFFSYAKKKGKRTKTESNWRDYYGSSDLLNDHIKLYGKENFNRTILHLCRTKGDSGYLETQEQMNRNVLQRENNRKIYYNANINSRYFSSPTIYNLNNLEKLEHLEYVNREKNKEWINNGKISKLVLSKNVDKQITLSWKKGKLVTCENFLDANSIPYHKTNPLVYILMVKDKEYEFVSEEEKDEFLKNDWIEIEKYKPITYHYCTNNVSQKKFEHKVDRDEFVQNNKFWHHGKINNKKGVYMINMENNEKIFVDKKTAKYEPMLTKPTTLRVKIKRKNRIIFKGFITLFFLQNPSFPKAPFLNALKTEDGFCIGKGKNKYLTKEKYHISLI